MHLAQLRLRDFRNYERMDMAFAPGFHVLLGDNAQGKTNILEAIYLLATLRSFRGVASAQLVRHGRKHYFAGATVVSQATREIKMYWSASEQKLSLDGQPVKRLGDYLGALRAVVFCTEDLQLIKGTGMVRRRFLDLLLVQTFPHYLPLLQRYATLLRSRNALLKQPRPDETALEGFTRGLVSVGNQIIQMRTEIMPRIVPLARAAYEKISQNAEPFELAYQPTVKADFARELERQRDRERAMRTTCLGPHRDEILLTLGGKSAAKYASEGQKRSIAIALKMTQAEHMAEVHGSPPILLIDDIMGELDARRRVGFLPLLNRAQHAQSQVFMTCTEENWPRELGRDLRRWEVKNGTLRASQTSV
jgi:DNA replication and repair protein RecF